MFGLYTALTLLLFGYHYLDDLANGRADTWLQRIIEQMTGAYAALVLLPLILWVTRRFPPQRSRWIAVTAAWIGGALVYTALHTTLMALSRAAIYQALHLGPYDYGIMFFRYPMEASNDLVSYAIIATIVFFWDRTQAARAAELHAAELQAKLAQAKLENLRLQLHPHFLFNTLNAISNVMYEDVRKADEMLAKLSDFLRLVLASSDVQQVPLHEELHLERTYVDIMTTRLERSLTLDVRVDDDARDAIVPFMLLQPLLENSIRHGMNGNRSGLALQIDVRRRDSSTIIRVSDDGNGLAEGSPRGIGLNNVESRLQYMYGAGASLRLEPRETGGTQATIVLPFAAGAHA